MTNSSRVSTVTGAPVRAAVVISVVSSSRRTEPGGAVWAWTSPESAITIPVGSRTPIAPPVAPTSGGTRSISTRAMSSGRAAAESSLAMRWSDSASVRWCSAAVAWESARLPSARRARAKTSTQTAATRPTSHCMRRSVASTGCSTSTTSSHASDHATTSVSRPARVPPSQTAIATPASIGAKV